MKLSDLIFESQILLEDKFEIRKTPNGRAWGVYNTTVTPNVLISSHKTKNQANIKADQLRNPTPPKPKNDSSSKSSRGDRNKSKTPRFTPSPTKVNAPNVSLTKGLFQSGEKKWTIIFPDGKGYVDVDDGKAANNLQRHIETLESQGKSPKEISKEFDRNRRNFLLAAGVDDEKLVQQYRRNPITRSIKKLNISEFEQIMKTKSSSSIASWFAGSRYQSLSQYAKLGWKGLPLNHFAMLFGIAKALHDIEEEIAQGGDEAKLREEQNILRGQMILISGALLAITLKDIKFIKSMIGPFRALLRTVITAIGSVIGIVAGAGGGAVVGSGGGPVGTIAGGAAGAVKGAAAGARGGRLLSILAGEASSYVVLLALQAAPVQRLIASLFQGWWFGDLLEFSGAMINEALFAAEEWAEGTYGTGFLASTLGTEQLKKEGPTGEYYSESEWAKKLFGVLLFPPGDETKFVPYMPETKREDLMSNLLMPQNVENDTTNSVDAAIDKKMDSDNAAAQQTDQTPVS
jgi:hypothetical protein